MKQKFSKNLKTFLILQTLAILIMIGVFYSEGFSLELFISSVTLPYFFTVLTSENVTFDIFKHEEEL